MDIIILMDRSHYLSPASSSLGDHKKKLMNLGTKSELVGELENGAEEMEGRAKLAALDTGERNK